jgi:hypothetical protein
VCPEQETGGSSRDTAFQVIDYHEAQLRAKGKT